jgi:hypothetical protein
MKSMFSEDYYSITERLGNWKASRFYQIIACGSCSFSEKSRQAARRSLTKQSLFCCSKSERSMVWKYHGIPG